MDKTLSLNFLISVGQATKFHEDVVLDAVTRNSAQRIALAGRIFLGGL